MLFRVVWVREGVEGLIHEPVSIWFKAKDIAENALRDLQQKPENAHKVLIVSSLPSAQAESETPAPRNPNLGAGSG